MNGKIIFKILVMFSFVVNIFLSAPNSLNAYAASWNLDTTNLIEMSPKIDGSSEINVYEVCGGLPYHKMVAHGYGYVFINNKDYIVNGACWQCANCNKLMVTEGDIIFNQMQTIGKWALINYNGSLNGIVTYIYEPTSYGKQKSNKMDGYKFFLAS